MNWAVMNYTVVRELRYSGQKFYEIDERYSLDATIYLLL